MGKKTKKEHRRISTNHRCLTLQDNHISQRTDWVYIVASIKDLTLFYFQIEKKTFCRHEGSKNCACRHRKMLSGPVYINCSNRVSLVYITCSSRVSLVIIICAKPAWRLTLCAQISFAQTVSSMSTSFSRGPRIAGVRCTLFAQTA